MKALRKLISRKKLNSIRHYRAVQNIFNFINRKQLVHLKELYQQANLKKSYLSTIQFEQLKHLTSTPLWLEERDSSLALLDHPTFLKQSAEYQYELKKWSSQGYIHLKGFFNPELSDRMAELTENLWDSTNSEWRFGDRRVLAAFDDKEMWDFLNNERLSEIVSMLMGHEILLLDSIHFLRGDEQPIHSDSFYMSTFPVGRLIGAWVSLEDIHKDSGPFCYLPGTHTMPYVTNKNINNVGTKLKTGNQGNESYISYIENLTKDLGIEPQFHLPEKGDLFLWHANLLHGGSKIHDSKRTRKSMVGHFTAKDVICYHENSQRPTLRYPSPIRK